jgi:hypothetical protein
MTFRDDYLILSTRRKPVILETRPGITSFFVFVLLVLCRAKLVLAFPLLLSIFFWREGGLFVTRKPRKLRRTPRP